MNKTAFHIFEKDAKRYLQRNQRQRRFVNYHEAESFLLLFDIDTDEKITVAEAIKQRLKDDGKHAVAIGYVSQKGVAAAYKSDEILLFNKKSIGLLGKPNERIITEIESFKYDILIDLSINSVVPLCYVSLYAHAQLKVSSKVVNFELFDFILDVNKQKIEGKLIVDELFLFEQVNFYLKSIQTNN